MTVCVWKIDPKTGQNGHLGGQIHRPFGGARSTTCPKCAWRCCKVTHSFLYYLVVVLPPTGTSSRGASGRPYFVQKRREHVTKCPTFGDFVTHFLAFFATTTPVPSTRSAAFWSLWGGRHYSLKNYPTMKIWKKSGNLAVERVSDWYPYEWFVLKSC